MRTFIRHLIIVSLLLLLSSDWMKAAGFTADITQYTYADYHMSPVNTYIEIDGLRSVYMANTNGVAYFNGNTWGKLPLPFSGPIHTVCALGDTVFVGGGMTIGMAYGQRGRDMRYADLLRQVRKLSPYEFSVRSIEGYNSKDVYFSTSIGTMHYDGSKLSYVTEIRSSGKRLHKTSSLKGKEEIIVQGDDGALYKLASGKAQLLCANAHLLGHEVAMVVKIPSNLYEIATTDGCLFTMNQNGSIIDALPSTHMRINTGAVSPDGRYLALGTLGDGLYVRDHLTGKTVKYGADRLGSMNVSHVAFTEQGQLWVALDCSVASVTFNPSEFLWLTMQEAGTLLDACQIGNTTYMATSNGMFAAKDEKVWRYVETPLVPISLSYVNGDLLLGTIGQTARLGVNGLNSLHTGGRIEGCSQIAQYGKDLILMKAFGGVFLLKRQKNEWRMVSNPVQGNIVKRAEFESNHVLWTLDFGGLTRWGLSPDLSTLTSKQSFSQIAGISCKKGTFLVRWMGQCLCINAAGVYTFDAKRKKMVRHELLSKAIDCSDATLAIDTDAHNKLWVMTNANLTCYNTDGIAEKIVNIAGLTPLEYYGAYYFSVLGDSTLLLATSQGTMRFDLQNHNKAGQLPGPPIFETLSYLSADSLHTVYINATKRMYLPANAHQITIAVTNGLSSSHVKYSYNIDAGQNLPWQTSGSISIDLLPYGEHLVTVNDNFGHSIQLTLMRDWPFYLTWYMITVYLLLIATVVAAIVFSIQRRKRQRLQTEMAAKQRQFEEELHQKEKEQLLGRIQTQSNQLKERMRFLTMKQEILNSLSTEIEAQKKEIGNHWPDRLYRRIIDFIQRSRTEEDHLLSFENYFVDVQRDFMIRLQQHYPQLSPGELRFCCLLKSNLSTKEIANILSITPRSVDLKKYRLKKKFELSENDSLTSFIAGLE